jgi:hypothetical protein
LAVHVEHTREMRTTYKIIAGNRPLREPRRICECRPNVRCKILKKEGVRVMIGLRRLKIGYSDICEHGNEHSVFRDGEVLELLSECRLFKRHFVS